MKSSKTVPKYSFGTVLARFWTVSDSFALRRYSIARMRFRLIWKIRLSQLRENTSDPIRNRANIFETILKTVQNCSKLCKTVPKLFQNCPKLFHRNDTFLNANYKNLNSLYFFILKDTHYHTTNNTIVRALLISNQKVFCNFETKMCSKTVPKLFKTVPKLFQSSKWVGNARK